MAEGLAVSVKELYELVESGNFAASEALPALVKGSEALTGDVPDIAATKLWSIENRH